MSAPTAGDFLGALKTQLAARFLVSQDFTGVNVHLINPDLSVVDAVVLVRGRITEAFEYATVGLRRRNDDVTVPGLVRAFSTGPTAFQTAINRAAAILAEVAAEARDAAPTVGLQTRSARVAAVSWLPWLPDKGGVAVDCEYDLIYSARVT